MDIHKYSDKGKRALEQSERVAKQYQNQSIEPEHLLRVMLTDKSLNKWLVSMGVEVTILSSVLEDAIKGFRRIAGVDSYLSPRYIKLMGHAETCPAKYGTETVELEHIILCLVKYDVGHAGQQLQESGLDPSIIEAAMKGQEKPIKKASKGKGRSLLDNHSVDLLDKARDGELGPVIGRSNELRRMIQILSRSMKNNPVLIGGPGVGKTAILEGLALRMINGDVPSSLKNKRLLSLDLSSVVAGASLRGQFEERLNKIVGEVKDSNGNIILFIDEIHTLVGSGEGKSDASGLLKGPLARGEVQIIGRTTIEEYRSSIEKDAALERRLEKVVVEEPSEDETLSILRGIKQGFENTYSIKVQDPALSAAISLSKRYLPERNLPDKAIMLVDEASSRLQIELESTPTTIDESTRELTRLKSELKALENEHHESTKEHKDKLMQDISSLEGNAKALTHRWENESRLIQKIAATEAEISQATQELKDFQLSGNVDEATRIEYEVLISLNAGLVKAKVDLEGLRKNGALLREEVGANDIAEVIAEITGIPVNSMLESEREKLLRMEAEIGKEVIGQSDGIRAIAKSVRRSRAGLNDPSRPVGSFFFLGPSGVGKTLAAKALTKFLFQEESNLIRFDMSEFGEKHTVARLLGSPPGYQGADEGGQLTEAVRAKPYSVLLFDEVEKAHPDIFNILLQILDDGRLTDSKGLLVDFKNTVIIMTSNVGAKHLLDSTVEYGHVTDDAAEKANIALREKFRPEFIGRIDEIIMFHGLTLENLSMIAELEINKVRKLLAVKKLGLEFSAAARSYIINQGYDPKYGARPLRRAIQRNLQDPLSVKILEDAFQAGDTIIANLEDDCITFAKE